ncbi:hypothetical protein [Streptosporangium oxazolinicum]|uniref:hypothetical protein n=1 Tax=Streptosporangium oxazolinicum TaxID=909287 RepID=UPI0031EC6A3D
MTPDDVLRRCLWARQHNEGHPSGAWSTGEQLAVAIVLEDRAHLDAMDYTVEQAHQRVLGGMVSPPADPVAWFESIRVRLALPVAPFYPADGETVTWQGRDGVWIVHEYEDDEHVWLHRPNARMMPILSNLGGPWQQVPENRELVHVAQLSAATPVNPGKDGFTR